MMNLESVGRTLVDYLGQRSTWLGLVAVLSSMGFAIEPDMLEDIIGIGLGVAGIISMAWPDEATPKKLTKDDLQAAGRELKRHE